MVFRAHFEKLFRMTDEQFLFKSFNKFNIFLRHQLEPWHDFFFLFLIRSSLSKWPHGHFLKEFIITSEKRQSD